MSVGEAMEPRCPPDGALLKVTACAVCPTDIKMARVGQRDLSYPRILGHEVVGVVEEVRSTATLSVGDMVQVWPGVACGHCPQCLQGLDNMCAHQGIIGFNHDGGFAEIMAVPAQTVARGGVNILPSGADPILATLTEPLACCVHGQNAASVSSRDRVVVFGAGPMGLMHTVLARRKGALVLVVEPDRERRELAVRMGADASIDPAVGGLSRSVLEWTNGRGADVAVLATPKVKIDDDLLRLMAPRGRICAFSGLPKNNPRIDVDINQLHYRELSLVGAYGCNSASDAEAFGIIAQGEVDLRPLTSQRLPLSSIEEAFRAIEERRALKCIIDDLKR
jgi:L-iditol 2-dehydrogenase